MYWFSAVNNTYLEKCVFLLILYLLLYSMPDSLCIALRHLFFFLSFKCLSCNIMGETVLITSCPFVEAPGCFAEARFATSWEEEGEVLSVWWQTLGLHKTEGANLSLPEAADQALRPIEADPVETGWCFTLCQIALSYSQAPLSFSPLLMWEAAVIS